LLSVGCPVVQAELIWAAVAQVMLLLVN